MVTVPVITSAISQSPNAALATSNSRTAINPSTPPQKIGNRRISHAAALERDNDPNWSWSTAIWAGQKPASASAP